WVIADVGATVVERDGLRPVAPLQWQIDSQWTGVVAVLDALAGVEGLVRQPVPQERRVSFFTESEQVIAEVRGRLQHLPVEVLHSGGQYLDVLPRGVSKGSTLSALVNHLGADPDRVLVAGDTLNDLSLFETGFPGVVVGKSEPGLVEATRNLARVHHASAEGAGGVLEGMRRWIPDLTEVTGVPAPEGEAQLVMVYHRLPWEERREGGHVTRQPHSSPNGILPTLLGSFAGGRQGSWVAWSTSDAEESSGVRHELV